MSAEAIAKGVLAFVLVIQGVSGDNSRKQRANLNVRGEVYRNVSVAKSPAITPAIRAQTGAAAVLVTEEKVGQRTHKSI